MARSDFPKNGPIFYADVTSNLDVHPDTGDLFRITNSNAIKRSIRNIVLTNRYERFWNPNLGCNITALLFENGDADSLNMASNIIKNSITTYETRVTNVAVAATVQPQQHTATITIQYQELNNPALQTLIVPIVSRVR